jgi:hypothetical protein
MPSVPSAQLPAPGPMVQAFLDRPHRLLIGDVWRDGSAEPLTVENPAREQSIAQVTAAGRDDVDAAVASTGRGTGCRDATAAACCSGSPTCSTPAPRRLAK